MRHRVALSHSSETRVAGNPVVRMVGMRFTEIGQQLRAYRLESGLRAEEIAARLGVSRAALYRYEKGEVIKLDTVKRLAELLKISPLSLLGIGVEYYNRPVAFFERVRQLEESVEQILQVCKPTCYLTSSGLSGRGDGDLLWTACRRVGRLAGVTGSRRAGPRGSRLAKKTLCCPSARNHRDTSRNLDQALP